MTRALQRLGEANERAARMSPWAFGYDAGWNGANKTNCNFAIFSSKERTKAWERGNAAGLRRKTHYAFTDEKLVRVYTTQRVVVEKLPYTEQLTAIAGFALGIKPHEVGADEHRAVLDALLFLHERGELPTFTAAEQTS